MCQPGSETPPHSDGSALPSPSKTNSLALRLCSGPPSPLLPPISQSLGGIHAPTPVLGTPRTQVSYGGGGRFALKWEQCGGQIDLPGKVEGEVPKQWTWGSKAPPLGLSTLCGAQYCVYSEPSRRLRSPIAPKVSFSEHPKQMHLKGNAQKWVGICSP